MMALPSCPAWRHFVDLLRKVKRPALVVRLLELASGDALPELQALADASKRKTASQNPVRHFPLRGQTGCCHPPAPRGCRQNAVILLSDDYGAQAVQAVLDARREDDATVLAMPSDRHSRIAPLSPAGVSGLEHAAKRASITRAQQVMHRQWKSEHFSSHYLWPQGRGAENVDDIREGVCTRIAELFPHVPKEQILIEQFCAVICPTHSAMTMKMPTTSVR